MAQAFLLSLAMIALANAPGDVPPTAKSGAKAASTCREGSFAAVPLLDPRSALAAASVSVPEVSKLIAAFRVPTRCDAKVAGVFNGGIITTTGNEWEMLPDGSFLDQGSGARVNLGTYCPTRGYVKCLQISGMSPSYIGIRASRTGGSLTLFTSQGNTVLLSTHGRSIILDAAYLPAPDTAGGRLLVYMRTPNGAFVVVLETSF